MTRREAITICNQLATFEYGNSMANVEPVGKNVNSFKLHYAAQRSIEKVISEEKVWKNLPLFKNHEKTGEYNKLKNEIISKKPEKPDDKFYKKQQEEFEKLNKEFKEVLDFNQKISEEYNKFLDEEIEKDFSLYTIKEEFVPNDLTPIQTECIRKIIVPSN